MKTSLLALALVAALLSRAGQAGDRLPVLTKLDVDPGAQVVDVFQGMAEGSLNVRLVHHDETAGQLFVENTTDQPLTVKLPDAFVGVHVLNQFGMNGGLFGGNQGSGSGQGQSRGGQVTGGGVGNGSGLNGQSNGLSGGPGFFSIPPERTVRVPVRSVCLEHGKPEPTPRMEYTIFPVEHVSDDPVLKEVLVLVAQGRIGKKPAQAAAWHLANGKDWSELSRMNQPQLANLPGLATFTARDLQVAQSAVRHATEQAEARPEASDRNREESTPSNRVAVREPRRSRSAE